MELELRFFANFREAVGRKTLEREYPEGTAVGEVLGDLAEEFDVNLFEDGELRQQLSIMKNGKDVVHLDGVDTPLADGDVLSVFPPVAGGSVHPSPGAGETSLDTGETSLDTGETSPESGR